MNLAELRKKTWVYSRGSLPLPDAKEVSGQFDAVAVSEHSDQTNVYLWY